MSAKIRSEIDRRKKLSLLTNLPVLVEENKEALDTKLNNTSDTLTGDLEVTGKITLGVDGVNSDGVMLEGGKHSLSANDDKGNFNLRVGNIVDRTGTAVEVCSEAGKPNHMEWDTASGELQFNQCDTTLAVGDPITWTKTFSIWPSGDCYVLGNLYEGGTTLSSKYVKTSGVSTILNSDTTANASYTGLTLNHDMSGSDALTADRSHNGLAIDIDSTATGGDTNHEHRVYGINTNVLVTGDSDIINGLYTVTRNNMTTGICTAIYSNYNYVQGDNTGGTISNLYASYNLAYQENAGTVTNAFGSYNRAQKQASSTGTSSTLYGSYNEVQIDSGAGTITTAYAVRAAIDNDTGSTTKIGTGYLYYGAYEGTLPANAWGVYIAANVPNYFNGNVTVGTSTSTASNLVVKRVTNGVSDQIQWYSGATLMGQLGSHDTTWTRINQSLAKNIYTPRSFYAAGNIIAYYSDERLKDIDKPLEGALEKIGKWRAVHYHANEIAGEYGYDTDKAEIGLLTQDIEKDYPELIEDAPCAIDDDTDYKTLNYDRVTAVLVSALQDQIKINKELLDRLDKLERLII